MTELEIRVAALEQSNRRYRLLFGIVLVVMAGFIAAGAGGGAPDKVQAKAFELINDSGAVLASITPLNGSGSISTYNAQGKTLTDIVPTQSNGGGLVTYDGAGHQLLKFSDVSGGGGSIVINNGDGQKVVELERNSVGAGSILLRNKGGNQIGQFTSDTADKGALLIFDETGKQTARVPGSP